MTFLMRVGSEVSCIGMVPLIEGMVSLVVLVVEVSEKGMVTGLGLKVTCLVVGVSLSALIGWLFGNILDIYPLLGTKLYSERERVIRSCVREERAFPITVLSCSSRFL